MTEGAIALVTDPGAAPNGWSPLPWPAAQAASNPAMRADLDAFLSRLGPASDASIDLCRLAVAALAADRSTPRGSDFNRSLSLRVPVVDPDRWTTAAVDRAVELLGFLSGDEWSLEIASGTARGRPTALQVETADRVTLLSGGLDSLAGAAIDVLSKRQVTLLSAEDNPIATASQGRVVKWLEGATAENLSRISVRVVPSGREPTRRTRSLFFIAFAIAAASARGAAEVSVPENGYTSLNPPLQINRGGPFSTRSTHPWTFRLLEGLLASLELDVALVNEHAWRTKGELVSIAADAIGHAAFPAGAAVSMSCGKLDGKNYLGGNAHRNCGLCVSCIVRRAGIQAAGLDDRTEYLVSTLRGAARDKLIRHRREDVQAVRAAIRHEIDDTDLIASAPFPDDYDLDRAIDLCRRGVSEVEQVILPDA